MKRGPLGSAGRALLAGAAAVLGAFGLAAAPLILPATLPVSLPYAMAAEPEASVTISIDAMVPALPQRDGTVRLSGTVTNTSDGRLHNLQAIFWRSFDPIQDDEGMQQALTSDANEPLGARRVQAFQNIPSEQDRTLDQGTSTPFDLTVDVADLDLPQLDAVYLIGVHVRGRTSADGAVVTLGRGRIFMPLVEQDTENTLQMTSVVVLSSRPSLLPGGIFSDDHLAEEVGDGGRLRALLTTAREVRTSFAVDPGTISELEAMSDGYEVLGAGETETTPGTGQAEAGRWLDDFDALRQSGDGFRVLFGSPDLTALVRDSQQDVIEQSDAVGDAVTQTADLPLLAFPAGGRADAATVAAVDSVDPRAVLLSDVSARGPGPLLMGPGTAPIIRYSSTAFGGGPGPEPRDTPAKLRQRMLSDTWLEASTSEPGTTLGRVRLIGSAAQAAGAELAESPPWMRSTTLSNLLDSKPSQWDGDLRYGAKAQAAELSAGQLRTVRRLSDDFSTITDLLTDPEQAEEQESATLARAASSAWRRDPEAAATYTEAVEQRVDQVLDGQIGISVNPRITTTGRTGTFPITIRNGLPAPAEGEDEGVRTIKVSLRFTSANAQRLTVTPLEDIIVPAGQQVQEEAQVRAETNGTVRVSAQLYTESGRAVGRAEPIEVNATQAGTTGWIIAIAAGIVLVGTTALRIRQVARERSTAGQPEAIDVSHADDDEDSRPTPPREPLDV